MKPTIKKPKAKVVGKEDNIFNLIGIVKKALHAAGQAEKASEMVSRVFKSSSYEEALSIMQEYCDLC